MFSSMFLVRRITVSSHPSTHFHLSAAAAAATTTVDSQSLFKQYGLTPSQITSIFSRSPNLVRADPSKTLKPKLDFLTQQGISGENLVYLISKHPSLLSSSLKRKLAPCITFLRSFARTDTDVLELLYSGYGSHVVHKYTESVPVNVASLRNLDVPYENVVKLFRLSPATLARECRQFDRFVEVVDGMGFDRRSIMFIHGLYAVAAMKEDLWGKKVEELRKLGLSEEDVKALVLRQPKFMMASKEHMRKSIEFFRNELGWSVEDVLKYPTALLVSFENTVLPRVRVLKVLMSKGLLKKGYGSSFLVREDVFLKRYVLKHEKEVPGILEVYGKNKKLLSGID